MNKRILISIVIFFTICSKSWAEDFASKVVVLDNSATMYETKTRLVVLKSTGPVGSAGIPNTISIGDEITVDKTSIIVGFIKVKYVDRDMVWNGEVIARKGDITCVVVASLEDIPSDDNKNRKWINIKQCEVIE
tara:strand:- start:3 stop:404 length:402 start_codon:yes stop_codon:yes gene_type:complete